MPIDPVNPDDAAASPALDEEKIADRIYQRLAADNARASAPPVPQTGPVDPAVELYRSLKAQGYDDDFIRGQLTARQAVNRETEALVTSKVAQVLNFNRDKEINSLVNRFIREEAKSDGRFKTVASIIHDRFAERLNASPARQKELAQGVVNEDACETLLTTISDELVKEMGWESKKTSNNPALPGKSGQSSQAQKAAEAAGGGDDMSGFTDHQEAFYEARKESLIRYGRLSKEDAHKTAYNLARNMPAPSLKGRNVR